ncbi:MAG: hypothetical protein AAF485_06705 [Chloroflexota bacterium]
MKQFEKRQLLTECGLTFAHITTGDYPVGFSGDQYLAKPPQHNYHALPLATPAETVPTSEFFISKELLRLSHWMKIVAHPQLTEWADLIPTDLLEAAKQRKITTDTTEIQPTADDLQRASFEDEKPKPRQIPQQLEVDPVLELSADLAMQVAEALGASLPRWYAWEIATRGSEAWLYPWGNVFNLKEISLELQDYSVDDEGVMGFYRYDQYVYFIHSFGPYADMTSPFGLSGLARPGREWNLCHQNKPTPDDACILRSICDLGAMSFMIPGIRPMTWGFGDWLKTKKHLAFSGPILPCYAPPSVGLWIDRDGDTRGEPLYDKAGFRLLFR